MTEPLQKTCEICQQPFKPDARLKDKQSVCSKIRCQRERKQRSQKKWLAKNPDYFKGRYPQLKEQILRRRQQLKRLSTPPKSAECQEADGIQDELTFYKNNSLNNYRIIVSIQDVITFKITISNQEFIQRKKCVYKFSKAIVFE